MPRRKRSLSEKKSDAGRIGGFTTSLRRGPGHYRMMANSRKVHAGPRLKTLEELKAEQQPAVTIIEGGMPTSLRELKRLYARKTRGELLVFTAPGSPGR